MVNLAEPISVGRSAQAVRLTIRLMLERASTTLEGAGNTRHLALAKGLWRQLGDSLAIPLAKTLYDQKGLDEIFLAVSFDERRYLFGVNSRVETKVEMECVPGYETQYVTVPSFSCFGDQRTGGRCPDRQEVRQIYNPCKTRAPVTKSEVKIDPKVGATVGQAQAAFSIALDLVDEAATADSLSTKIDILLIDSKGHKQQIRASTAAADPPK